MTSENSSHGRPGRGSKIGARTRRQPVAVRERRDVGEGLREKVDSRGGAGARSFSTGPRRLRDFAMTAC